MGMSSLRMTPEGEKLIDENPDLRSVLDEFVLEEPDIRNLPTGKSYRGEYLGEGGHSQTYALRGYPIAEKIIWKSPRPERPDDRVFNSFDRNLQAREFWQASTQPDSFVYVPEYYAAVEHSDGRGAILLERIGFGYSAAHLSRLVAAKWEDRQKIVAEKLGVADFDTAFEQVLQALKREKDLIEAIFRTAVISDGGNLNILIKWVQEDSEKVHPLIVVVDV